MGEQDIRWISAIPKGALWLLAHQGLSHCCPQASVGTQGLSRGEGREGSASEDSQSFSHPLVTVWEKVQKHSSEKQVTEEDGEGGQPHQSTAENCAWQTGGH